AVERQGHRAKAVRLQTREIVGIVGAKARGVVADHDGAAPQTRRHQLERRTRHPDPDVHQHEIYRALDAIKGLAQVAFAQIDEIAEPRLREMRPRGFSLGRLIFGGDHHAIAAGGVDVVPDGGGEIKRRDTERRADLHDPARIGRAAKLIAELRLVAVERDELVAEKSLELAFRRPVPVETFEIGELAVEQALQLRVRNDAQAYSFTRSRQAS